MTETMSEISSNEVVITVEAVSVALILRVMPASRSAASKYVRCGAPFGCTTHAADTRSLSETKALLRSARSLFVFDIRRTAQIVGSDVQLVPDGQLVMHYDTYVGVRRARVVLLDDAHLLRAATTSFWLNQLNDAEVFILRGSPVAALQTSEPTVCDESSISPNELAAEMDRRPVAVIDVGSSFEFERCHVEGAYFMVGSSLPSLEALWQLSDPIVFTSPDGQAARLASRDMARLGRPGRWLGGGTQAWAAEKYPVEQNWDPVQLLTTFLDDWGSPMWCRREQRGERYRQFLEWERGVAGRTLVDPTMRFVFARLARQPSGLP